METVADQQLLFVVFGARINLESPVDLLAEHDPCQLMREGHGGHGHSAAGFFHCRSQSVGGTDDKGDAALPHQSRFIYKFSKAF